MQLLVVGSGGLVGSNLVVEAQARDWDVMGTYHTSRPGFDIPLAELDLRDIDSMHQIVQQFEPDALVNCAAMTDVDQCETDLQTAIEINGVSPGELASICNNENIRFTQLSTDYVFPGSDRSPYTEDDRPRPIQKYGGTKLLGEYQTQSKHRSPLIVRLSFVYGIHAATGLLTGFPSWVRDRLEDKSSTPLFTDQFVTPTRARAAARTICDLLMTDETDVFHVASQSCITPYEFGKQICDTWGYNSDLLDPSSRTTIDRVADRPEYSCLDVSKVERVLDRQLPTLDKDLEELTAA